MLIESVQNEKVKYFKKIRNKKYIMEFKEYIVEGEHLVEEAIKAGKVVSLIVLNGFSYESDLPKYFVTEKVMSSISLMQSYPNIMAVVKLGENLKELSDRIIILENVQDPGNVGTIIRTSVAFGFDTIFISNDSASIYNDKVIRSSQGMIFHTNIIIGNISEFIETLKEKNYKIYSTSLDGSYDIKHVENDKLAFVLGNEGGGVTSSTHNLCDGSVKIPMNTKCESLNVAVAGAIIMYEKRKI